MPTTIPLTPQETLSGILGSISLTCWIFLLLPQLLENYRNSSASAVSLSFIFIWFLGDIANLLGALGAGLVPVVVAIAVYFCISDGVLVSQCLYYGIRERRKMKRELLERGESVVAGMGETQGVGEQTALLREAVVGGRARSGSYTGTIPGSEERSRRRSSQGSSLGASDGRNRRISSSASAKQARNEQLAKILEERDENGARLWVKNLLSVLAIVIVGTAGWAAAWGTGAWKPMPENDHGDKNNNEAAIGSQVLGYLSAVAYLGARIPQIMKNWREKSCEGLSLLFFMLSLLGNLTYGAGILAHSLEREYVIKNVPWLIGSLGTMAEDVIIFFQFHWYRTRQDEEESAIS